MFFVFIITITTFSQFLNWEVSKIFLLKINHFYKRTPISAAVGVHDKKRMICRRLNNRSRCISFCLGFVIKIARNYVGWRQMLAANPHFTRWSRWKTQISLTWHLLLIHRIWKRSKSGWNRDWWHRIWKLHGFGILLYTANLKRARGFEMLLKRSAVAMGNRVMSFKNVSILPPQWKGDWICNSNSGTIWGMFLSLLLSGFWRSAAFGVAAYQRKRL